jgi:hypothetical protein
MAEWNDAEGTPPRDGQYVWAFNETIGVKKGRYNDDEKGRIWTPDGSLITHWMPREPDPGEGEAD